jgi:hypothetical protein
VELGGRRQCRPPRGAHASGKEQREGAVAASAHRLGPVSPAGQPFDTRGGDAALRWPRHRAESGRRAQPPARRESLLAGGCGGQPWACEPWYESTQWGFNLHRAGKAGRRHFQGKRSKGMARGGGAAQWFETEASTVAQRRGDSSKGCRYGRAQGRLHGGRTAGRGWRSGCLRPICHAPHPPVRVYS